MKLLILAKSIDTKYQRLLARRTDGTPEAMAAEDARLRDLVERCTGPAAVDAIRAADAEARAKVREDFGIEYASEGGYAAEVIDFHGLQVVIENPVGSVRAGIDPDGKPWATELTASYGYISGTEGADGHQYGSGGTEQPGPAQRDDLGGVERGSDGSFVAVPPGDR